MGCHVNKQILHTLIRASLENMNEHRRRKVLHIGGWGIGGWGGGQGSEYLGVGVMGRRANFSLAVVPNNYISHIVN